MKKRIIFLSILIALLLPAASLKAAITSVTLTPASPTTLSNGNAYFLAGVQYTFRVQAVDAAATGKAYWNQIILTFPSGGETATISIDTDTVVGVPTGLVVDTITDNTAVYTNIDYNITVRFLWTATEYAAVANNIQGTVSNDIPQSVTDTRSVNHGVCSSIRVVNFAQSGVAADGYVNPWHSTFNVTGAIVYNVTGATIADKINDRAPGEVTTATLYTDGATTYLGGAPGWRVIADDDLTYIVPVGNGTFTLGNHTWTVIATMTTAGGPETSANTLTLNCDRVQITAITIINGGGTPVAPFYRSVNLPGTQIQITASRESGAPGGMVGDTTITVRNNTDGANFNVQILSGQTIGVANVTTPIVGDVPNGTTQLTDYQIIAISGSSYDNEQNAQNRILTPGDGGVITNSPAYDIQVYWDRNDPPGNNGAPGAGQTPFTAEASFGYTVTATSVTFNWQPVSALPFNGDFYTYRIYYKATLSPTWKIIDRSTPNYGPAQTYDLSNSATATATIIGLQPLTNYDYFMTAVDVFGQEVEHPIPSGGLSDALYVGAPTGTGYGQFTTNPTSVEASVTDGITNYTFAQFSASINATTRPLRKTSLRVTIVIISAGDQPDSVNLILSQDDGLGNGSPAGNLFPLLGAPLYEKISCTKSAPNTWQGYIPSTNQFLTEGNYCRFIIESIRTGVPTYSDIDSATDSDPNDFEYTFMVQTPTKFTPWPTRVLNNVITDKNPLCYPSYYLSDDAYVTITAYDIKGRPVATLIENGFRKGGQNIKEGGWSGENKARRKLGVGLYYLRFEAKRARDGKMILNETEKVVIAK